MSVSTGAAQRCVRSRPAPRAAPRCAAARVCSAAAPSEPPTALVAGATGGVGQLVVARLLAAGWRVRALVRSEAKARTLFGTPSGELEIVEADLREVFCSDTQLQCAGGGLFEGLDAVVCCTGTTAFPSARWEGDNGPRQTDEVGVRNLVAAVQSASPSLRRFVLVSSIGVTRTGQFPFLILNAFGVLNAKAAGEKSLRDSGMPYTILRPGRLTDGPYTSYDLNTLLRATSGERRKPQLAMDDSSTPQESSRLVVAAAAVAALGSSAALGRAFDVGSVAGEGPSEQSAEVWQKGWDALFADCAAEGAFAR